MNFVPRDSFAPGEGLGGAHLPPGLIDAVRVILRGAGITVAIEAEHGCETGRGVRTPGVGMVTSRLTGCFLNDPDSRGEALARMGY